MRTAPIASRRAFLAFICLLAVAGMIGCTQPSMTREQWQSHVIEATVPVLVEFYRPDCPSCTQLLPELQAHVAEYAGRVILCRINTDTTWDLTEANGIHRIPAVLLFVDGKEVRRWVNELEIDPYRAALEEILP